MKFLVKYFIDMDLISEKKFEVEVEAGSLEEAKEKVKTVLDNRFPLLANFGIEEMEVIY